MRELLRDSEASSSAVDKIQISSFVFPVKQRDQRMIDIFLLLSALFFVNSLFANLLTHWSGYVKLCIISSIAYLKQKIKFEIKI